MTVQEIRNRAAEIAVMADCLGIGDAGEAAVKELAEFVSQLAAILEFQNEQHNVLVRRVTSMDTELRSQEWYAPELPAALHPHKD